MECYESKHQKSTFAEQIRPHYPFMSLVGRNWLRNHGTQKTGQVRQINSLRSPYGIPVRGQRRFIDGWGIQGFVGNYEFAWNAESPLFPVS